MNVSEHAKGFEQEMTRRNYAKTSIETYASNIRLFFAWSKSDHPKNVTEKEIKQYLSSFDDPNTQRSHHSAIKLYFNICLGQKNKFKYIPYAKKSHKLPLVLSQEEVQRMFDACENLKHRVILALLYSTGIRVSELLNLEWKHINRARNIINIIAGKGKKDRQVPLCQELIPLLESYCRAYRPPLYVLEGQFGGKYSAKSVGEVVKQLAIKAGIDKRVYTHLMRHCSFTHMVEEGTDINLIKEIAGHSNVKTTHLYTHLSHNIISRINSPFRNIKINV